MDMLDMLLGAADKITERPTGEFEVSRLSKILGEKFIIKARALTMAEMDALPKGEKFKTHIILAAVTDPDLKSKQLREKFTPEGRKNPLTPVELVETLLLPGEAVNLYNSIMDLSGFGDDAVEKIVKN
jgi:hypothetical protein